VRHASCLKPRRLHAFEGGYVAKPLSPMVDDLYKDEGKPNKIEKGVREKGEICLKRAENRFNPTVTI
jgi:hypothetical protein